MYQSAYPTPMNRQTAVALYLTVLLLALGGVLWMGQKALFSRGPYNTPLGSHGTALAEPRPLEAFSLVDHRGQPFDLDSLKGQWTFLFFGFTHCPDMCPTTLAVMNDIDRRLRASLDESVEARFAFVSIDPERDTVAELANYVPHFNRDFIGLTGDPAQLRALAQPLGVLYARLMEQGDTMGYMMEHTTSIFLVGPEARWQAVFSPPHDPAGIAEAFLKIRQSQSYGS